MGLQRIGDRNNTYIYPWYFADLVATKDIRLIARAVVKETFLTYDNDFVTWYYDFESSDRVAKNLLKRTLREKDFFSKIIKNIHKETKSLLKSCQKINETTNFAGRTSQELFKYYQTYEYKLCRLRVFGWVPLFLDGLNESFMPKIVLAEFENSLKKRGLEKMAEQYYAVLCSTDKMSAVQDEEVARLRLLRAIKLSDPKSTALIIAKDSDNIQKKFVSVYKKLTDHTKKFGWLTYAYSGPPMSIQHLLELMSDNLCQPGSIENQLRATLSRGKEIRKERRQIMNDLKLSPRLIRLLDISAELMYLKDFRKRAYQKSYLLMDPLLEEIAKRLKINLRELKYLVTDEIKAALLNNRADYYRKLAKERAVKCCYAVKAGKIHIWSGTDCEKIIRKKIGNLQTAVSTEGIKELRGMIAYKGKVKGLARIILVAQDIHKINEGDILVSSSTNPDLLLAMKKAAAFITDLGGIISHAAIVSRELKKPCIVGTKIATHVIKDGDLVEVDAENGVVNILDK